MLIFVWNSTAKVHHEFGQGVHQQSNELYVIQTVITRGYYKLISCKIDKNVAATIASAAV